jgi:hypothetical protein
MAASSRRAARPPRKGGLENAIFIVAAAGAVPDELRGIGALVTVTLPWGSLLRGCLGLDSAVTAGICSLIADGGHLQLLLAPARRDRLPGIPTDVAGVVTAARTTFEPLGLKFVEGRPAGVLELRDSGSTWARRLLHGERGDRGEPERQAVLVRFRQPVASGR